MGTLFAAALLVMVIAPQAHCVDISYLSLTADEVQTISSTNYPGNYDDNEDKEWRITSELGSVIHIKVDFLDIEAHSNCSYDKLTISDQNTGKDLYELCGEGSIYPFWQWFLWVIAGIAPGRRSESNRVIVRFKSDQSETRQGFVLKIKQIVWHADFYSGTRGSGRTAYVHGSSVKACVNLSGERLCEHTLNGK